MPRLLDALANHECVVVVGKGGVGKTTVSVLIALEALEAGLDPVVASLDPAAHLEAYLRLSRRGRVETREGIRAIQYDFEGFARRVAAEYASLLRRLASALTALGDDDVEALVRDAPGFEEEVYLRMLEDALGLPGFRVIDTPPTGMTLRMLKLPSLYVRWVKLLYSIRERILSLRAAIASARGAGGVNPRDPVLERLKQLEARYSSLLDKMRSCAYVVVATPEHLPVHEAIVLLRRLNEMGYSVKLVVANRVRGWNEHLDRLCNEGCSVKPSPAMLVIREAEKPPTSLSEICGLKRLVEGPVSCGMCRA